jgi:hypothetical protein
MAASCLFDVINNAKTSYYSAPLVLERPSCLSFWQGNFVIIILKYVFIIQDNEHAYWRAGMYGFSMAHLDDVLKLVTGLLL